MKFNRTLRRRNSRHTASRRNAMQAPQLVERLELRQLLVGQVTAMIKGDNLILRGDNSANQVEIAFHEGNVSVRPKTGTRINGRRGQFIAFEGTDTVPGNIIVNMRKGDDSVALSRGLKVQGDVRMNGRQGADTIGLDNVIVRDDLIFLGGDGNDSVSVEDSRIVDDAKLKLSGGDDLVRIVSSEIRDNLKVRGSRGNDSIVIDDLDVRHHAQFRMQRGDDVIDIQNARIDGHLKIKMKTGDDSVVMDDSTIAGKARFNLGAGDDALILGNSENDDNTPAAGNIFKKSFRAVGRAGIDDIRVDIDNDFRQRRRESQFEGDDPGTGITDEAITAADDLAETIEDLIAVDIRLRAEVSLTDDVVVSGSGENEIFVTNQETVTITGRTDSDTDVEVDADGDGAFNDDDVTTTTDFNGDFTIEVPIEPGQTTVRVRNADNTDETTEFEIHRSEGTVVRMSTNLGDIDVELLNADAPNTVENFLGYFDRYGDNTIVHRSVSDFVIQGGGFTVDGQTVSAIDTDPPITNEFNSDNRNERATLSMAQLGGDINSGTSQWFVNVVDNPNLDAVPHTVFGRLIGGETGSSIGVADAINDIDTFDVSDQTGQSALSETPLQGYESDVTISGSVTIANGSNTVVGTGTEFTTELDPGDRLTIDGQNFTVVTIGADDDLTVSPAATSDLTDEAATTDSDVAPDESSYVIFSNIGTILDAVT